MWQPRDTAGMQIGMLVLHVVEQTGKPLSSRDGAGT